MDLNSVSNNVFVMQSDVKQLQGFGKVRSNESLSKHTTFKIGGPARFFVTTADVDQLAGLVQWCAEHDMPWMVLGGGSNMLMSDEGFDGVVVKISDFRFQISDCNVDAAAGVPTVKLASETVKAGLTGFAWGVGVPGTIGGAVRGNAGAMGGEMKDVVKEVDALIDGEIVTFSNEDCQFTYRHSIFKHNGGIILRVHLTLEKGDAKEEMARAMNALTYRNKTQPKGYASTGCIFKNVELGTFSSVHSAGDGLQLPDDFKKKGQVPAGWFVEQAGMKGAQAGRAMVSEVHGNFIINQGGASAKDVLSLVEQIKEAVYNRFGVSLQEEIEII
jgi:UDP-N-acetylmuramate dehydrogenase